MFRILTIAGLASTFILVTSCKTVDADKSRALSDLDKPYEKTLKSNFKVRSLTQTSIGKIDVLVGIESRLQMQVGAQRAVVSSTQSVTDAKSESWVVPTSQIRSGAMESVRKAERSITYIFDSAIPGAALYPVSNIQSRYLFKTQTCYQQIRFVEALPLIPNRNARAEDFFKLYGEERTLEGQIIEQRPQLGSVLQNNCGLDIAAAQLKWVDGEKSYRAKLNIQTKSITDTQIEVSIRAEYKDANGQLASNADMDLLGLPLEQVFTLDVAGRDLVGVRTTAILIDREDPATEFIGPQGAKEIKQGKIIEQPLSFK